MKKIKQRNGRLPLLLITAILTLCAGFLIVGCGTDPVLKVKDVNKGAYAVDFNACPGTFCYGDAQGSTSNPVPDITGKEITLEAWIKRSTASSVTGGVFSRLSNDGGALLYVKANEPKFAIRRQINPTSSPGENASIDYVVEAGSSNALVQNEWTHIAGVLANADHSSVHADCPDGNGNSTGGSAETPHLDIYINGVFKNCATTYGSEWTGKVDLATTGQFATNPVTEKIALGNIGSGIYKVRKSGTTTAPILEVEDTNNLGAVIDELRLWITGKTADEIVACMNKELGIGGTCDRGDPDLAAYYRLNEGTGKLITDFSGNGFAGGFFSADAAKNATDWDAADKWVAGPSSLTGAD